MSTFHIKPLKSVGEIEFGMDRELVRKTINRQYDEFRKNKFSINTTDDFGEFHVYYDKTNCCEAVEFFEESILIVNDKQLFPGSIDNIKLVFPDAVSDDYGYISYENSVGITVEDQEIKTISN